MACNYNFWVKPFWVNGPHLKKRNSSNIKDISTINHPLQKHIWLGFWGNGMLSQLEILSSRIFLLNIATLEKGKFHQFCAW